MRRRVVLALKATTKMVTQKRRRVRSRLVGGDVQPLMRSAHTD